jgi:hypothetical protein
LNATNVEHRDFIWYILKQAEKFDLKHDEIIANSGLFMSVFPMLEAHGAEKYPA